jgi:glucose/mannose-6-phosphate isomerase
MTNTLDTQDMLGMAAALPEQIDQAARSARNLEPLPDKERIENIVVIGAGGSGIAGDVLAATAAPFIPVPITVVKGYELPAFVGEGSLVFSLSYSGDTEETIEATTDAAVQGSKVVVVSSGGVLVDLAASWGAPIVRVPKTLSQARAALGALAIPPLAVLEDIGLFTGASQWIDQAVVQLKKRRDQLSKDNNIAHKLAKKLAGHAVVVSGGGGVGATAAQRWKAQINNNAKSVAFASAQPDVCHTEISGWVALSEWTKQKFGMVALRHDDEHPQISRRFDLAEKYAAPNLAFVENVRAQGDGDLAQLLDLVMIGDYVSLYLAQEEGIDPGPVPAVDDLKAALSQD